MKQIVSIILLTQVFFLQAQNFENSWTGYFSYVSIKSISQGDDKIYAAAENAIFTYDLSTQEIETVSTINGLSGKEITTAYYSESSGLYIIGYKNGLIEIVIDGDDNILKVVDILEKLTIPPDSKQINHFYEFNSKLYISTGYGISVYDLETLEFGDTYYIGSLGSQIAVTQTTVYEDFIYASTSSNGLKSALVNDENIIDYEQWTTTSSGGYKGIQTLGNELYALNNMNVLFRLDPNLEFIEIDSFLTNVIDFGVQSNILTITTENSIEAYQEGYGEPLSAVENLNYDYTLQSGYFYNNTFYLGTSTFGMLVVPETSQEASQVLPAGPLFNQPFSIDASPGQLWVSYGDVDLTFNPFPLTRKGISNFKNEVWKNIKYDTLIDQLRVDDANDLVYVKINQNNPFVTYISSYQKGLIKLNGHDPFILYNETNSPMDIPNGNEALGIRIFGSDFDRDQNLWLVQSRIDEGLLKLTPDGQFQTIDISNIIDAETELALSKLAVSRIGYVFFGAVDSGLIGYNPTTNQFNKIGEGLGTGNLPSTDIKALAFDNQNRLWIGTRKGLRVLYSIGSFFEDGAETDAQPIIILEDGVPQELLFLQSITDIEVDGSNNKWISTATSGVFYLSSNGQETLLRFTSDNSPLPSDNVLDIAIDDSSGKVYFATNNGLVAYNGTSTAPEDDLENVYAFPNPVRPNFSGNVTIDGLTAKANIKITDITGNLVFETTSEGGSIQWDTTAFGKYKVASGVYLILVTSDDNLLTKVTKIMIIR
ncbi:T9SS type A sorting domain-containing protein [Flavobacteriaceae bacterium]|nr:T9SS type A sorting domain-containing protein [Flavobacteriaceae bacterium]MDB4590117.1 T9SS type A sorting domain-containing protein [Flavobacteriaceae bacterium]MDC6467728.1 two-component regulator propeller domain-containing protein [Flavobacteriaceae bacterium]